MTVRIGNRDAVLLYILSMACLALALHAHTRMSSGWTTEETRVLVGVWGQANVQSELNGMARNRSIYARTFFPWRLSVLCVFCVIVEKPTATPAVQQLDVEP